MAKISIQAQINAVDTAKRALHSPAKNIMRGSERALLITQLDAVTKSLEFCEANIAAIHAFMATKKQEGGAS